MTGVIRSKLPRITQHAQIRSVKSVARCGSPSSCVLKYFRTGSTSSFAIAARRRGAPVKLWSAAPSVDSITPTCTTHGTGHAIVAVNNLPKNRTSGLSRFRNLHVVEEHRFHPLSILFHHHAHDQPHFAWWETQNLVDLENKDEMPTVQC